MTQLEAARRKRVTPAMRLVARAEGLDPGYVRGLIADGRAILLKHGQRYLGIGEGMRVKVNANIGTSSDVTDVGLELVKLREAVRCGADTVMDLSTGGNLDSIRRKIVRRSSVPIGTVPIYQAVIETVDRHGGVVRMDPGRLFDVIQRHAQDGVSFVTVHCGITLNVLQRLRRNPRRTMVVSRGGAFLISWMVANNCENPLYENYDRLLDIARRHDLVLSLGDGMRPGSVADSTDACQIEELTNLGELAKRAWERGVQVMIEGPGHIPLNEIAANVQIEKKLCHGAPFYVLGPVVTDIAPGYDHITGAIGGAVAAAAGADFLCYVTPGEHLSLPGVEDVVEGVIASRIAAHAADLARGRRQALRWDMEMDSARSARDWKRQKELSVNPRTFQRLHGRYGRASRDVCTMCGKYCALKLVQRYLNTRVVC